MWLETVRTASQLKLMQPSATSFEAQFGFSYLAVAKQAEANLARISSNCRPYAPPNPCQSKVGVSLDLTMSRLQSGTFAILRGVSICSIYPEQPNIDCSADNPAWGAGHRLHAWPCRQGSKINMLPDVVPASNATPRAAAMNGAAVLSCSTVMSRCQAFPTPAGLSET